MMDEKVYQEAENSGAVQGPTVAVTVPLLLSSSSQLSPMSWGAWPGLSYPTRKKEVGSILRKCQVSVFPSCHPPIYQHLNHINEQGSPATKEHRA